MAEGAAPAAPAAPKRPAGKKKKLSLARRLVKALESYAKAFDKFKAKKLTKKKLLGKLKAARKTMKRASKSLPAKAVKRLAKQGVARARKQGSKALGGLDKAVEKRVRGALGMKKPKAMRRGKKGGQYYLGEGGQKVYV